MDQVQFKNTKALLKLIQDIQNFAVYLPKMRLLYGLLAAYLSEYGR